MARMVLLLLGSLLLFPGSVAADRQDPRTDVDALFEASEAGVVATREVSVRLLGQIRPMRPEIVEAIAARLYDPSPSVYREAVRALAHMGADAAPAIGDLLSTIDRLPHPPAGAILALASAGQGNRRSVPTLARHLEKGGPLAAISADALGRLGPWAADAVPALLRTLRRLGPAPLHRSEERVRRSVLAALAHIGAPGVPILRSALSDPSAAVRSGAVFALARVEHPPTALKRDLLSLSDDPSPLVREEVERALALLTNNFPGRTSR